MHRALPGARRLMPRRPFFSLSFALCGMIFGAFVTMALGDDGDPIIMIHRPAHHQTVRTQSVHVEFDVLNFVMPEDGVAVVSIDGKRSSVMDQPQVVLIVPMLDEGLHELDVTLVDSHGKSTGFSARTKFQVATLWQPNMFQAPEVIISAPFSGQIVPSMDVSVAFEAYNVGEDVSVVAYVNNRRTPLTGITRKGDSFRASVASIPVGQHQLALTILDASGDAVEGATSTIVFESIATPYPTQSHREDIPTTRSLCMGVLVSMGPTTLHNTLESYRAAGLIGGDSGARLFVFVQALDGVLTEIANRFGANVVGFEEGIGKGNAWRYMADVCDREFILYLEEDFELVDDAEAAEEQLGAAMMLLRSGRAQVVRMRSRKVPGEPLWAERSFIDTGYVDDSHLLHYVHFWNHLHVRYPGVISLCHRFPMVHCARSTHAEYTNNPAMYSVEWVRSVLGRHFSRDDYNTMERRMRFSRWWETSNITVAHGDGLFTHNRMDRNDDEFPDIDALVPGTQAPPQPRVVRVIYLHHAMWVGGVERQILFLCKRMNQAASRLNLEVVLFMDEEGVLADQYRKLGVSVSNFPVYDGKWNLKPDAQVQRSRLVDHLRGADVVHSWFGGGELGTFRTFATQVVHEAKVPVVICMAWTVQVVDSLVSVAVMENDKLMELHDGARRIYAQAPGLDMPAIVRIDPGVDTQLFTSAVDRKARRDKNPDRPIVIGRVSRLVMEKDPKTFVSAAAIVAGARDDIRFVIWGDGAERANLEAHAKALGLTEDVLSFRGMTDDVHGALDEMDIFAYSTFGDSVGWVVLEAMSMGLPIIATDIDAIPTFVKDGQNGVLIDVGDVQSMASAMMFLADDEETRYRMGAASRKSCVDRFNVERYVKEYQELYQHIGNTRNVPKPNHVAKLL